MSLTMGRKDELRRQRSDESVVVLSLVGHCEVLPH